MAEEHVGLPSEHIQSAALTPLNNHTHESAGKQPAMEHRPSEIEALIRWVFGMVILIACSWGIIGGAYYLTRSPLAAALGWAAAFALLYSLEQDLWLNRLLGLRPTAGSSRTLWALFLSAAGPLILLLKSGSEEPSKQEPLPNGSCRPGTYHSTDNMREIVETVVFVIVLVLLLKSFVAEAFVIPTGSMAETLYGYQKMVTCPKCLFKFPVNCSHEVDPPNQGQPVQLSSCTCPNCRYYIDFRRDGIDLRPESGDRVLVDKSLYDMGTAPERFDVVVFKYPQDPQQNHVQMNYIKRLIGKPGETIAIYYGDLYGTQDLSYEGRPRPLYPDQTRTRDFTYENDDEARALFDQQIKNHFEKKVEGKGFEIIRKDPDKILALRRIVYDNQHQAHDVAGQQPPRWAGERQDRWTVDDAQEPRRFTSVSNDTLAWLNYRHILRNPTYQVTDAALEALRADGVAKNVTDELEKLRSNKQRSFDDFQEDLHRALPAADLEQTKAKILTHTVCPALVTDFMGYNTGKVPPHQIHENWVGDLMLECDVTVEQAAGELILDLSKGVDRFQARWDLATGACTLVRLRKGEKDEVLGAEKTPTEMKKKGTYRLRFANFDERLIVWVDSSLPFGPGVKVLNPPPRGPDENDLLPARIGVRGASVSLHRLQVWRDSYYTTARHDSPSNSDAEGNWTAGAELWREPDKWDPWRNLPFKTMYVQPEHYLCLGDNSPESSDGRTWGLVPRRLVLGRALLVYWPYNRAGPIR